MDEFLGADQFICGYNKTRHRFNNRVRGLKGFDSVLPVRGDKMICRKNNPSSGVFNGMIDFAASDAEVIDHMCYGIQMKELGYLNMISDNEKHDYRQHKRLNMFEYSWAISCHLAQGSEYNDIVVYNEPVGKSITDRRRWTYTALSRGKNRVTLIDPVSLG